MMMVITNIEKFEMKLKNSMISGQHTHKKHEFSTELACKWKRYGFFLFNLRGLNSTLFFRKRLDNNNNNKLTNLPGQNTGINFVIGFDSTTTTEAATATTSSLSMFWSRIFPIFLQFLPRLINVPEKKEEKLPNNSTISMSQMNGRNKLKQFWIEAIAAAFAEYVSGFWVNDSWMNLEKHPKYGPSPKWTN